MEQTYTTNPIRLPAPGVSRQTAAGPGARPSGQYDVSPLNPLGRRDADQCVEPKAKAKLLACKKNVIFSTMNTRTIREPDRQLELVHNMKVCNISVMGIQEHRIVHKDPKQVVCHHTIGDHYLVTSSAWRNAAQAAVGGVGIAMSPTAKKALTEVTSFSERVLMAKFQSNPTTTIIAAYSPTNSAKGDEKEKFRSNLRDAVESVPAHDFLAILGDFNGRLGADEVPYSYHQETNDNGKYLIDLMEEHALIAANTQLQKAQKKLWTWISPPDRNQVKHKQQIDFILVRRKWRNSIMDTQAFNSFTSVGSDHRIVSTRVRLSLRASRPKVERKVKYIWKALETDKGLQEKYTIEVRNKFQILEEEESATSRYERFINAHEDAAKEVLTPVPKRRKEERYSDDPRVIKAREEMETAYTQFISDEQKDGSAYGSKKEQLHEAYDEAMAEDLAKKIKEIENCNNNKQHTQGWNLIKEISGKKSAQSNQIEGKTAEERLDAWYDHFKNLLGNPPVLENEHDEIEPVMEELPIEDGPLTLKEYRVAKNSLKSGKSCGEDGIVPDVLKWVLIDDLVLYICNKAHMDQELPEQWTILNIIPIPKSGDLTKTDNYRGISLSSVVAKVYNRMILNRIRPILDPLLRINQNGFREKRTTTTQVLALRRIIEGVKRKHLPAVMTFIDFKKAFDTIHRGKLMQILRAYGIPARIVQSISNVYANTSAKVLSPDGETKIFSILAGVLQGDTLAPYLFIIVLDYALRQAISGKEEQYGFTITPRKSKRVGPVMQTDFDFADDIALVSNNVEQAQQLLLRVEQECRKVGLGLNAKKTEVVTYNIKEDVKISTLNGSVLAVKEDFKYLGSYISSTEKDIRVRKGQAWRALHDLKKMWQSGMTDSLKRELFVATVESILLYGSEAWTLTSEQEARLDGCYTRMLRMALNVTWRDRVRNDILYGKLPQVTRKIRTRRLRMAGHCVRHDDLAVSNLILWEPAHGVASCGGPKHTYVDQLRRDTGLSSADEIRSCMKDRSVWRAIVARGDPP